mgnify:CR=1 FL=1
MTDDVYYRLRDLLDSLPHGFPPSSDGLEIRILKKIFTREEAAIAVRMKLKYENAAAMAARTGVDEEYLKVILPRMANQGQIFGVTVGGIPIYRLAPFVFGIYEWQLHRLDRELVEMVREYFERDFGIEFYSHKPSLLRVVPIEENITAGSEVRPYESLRRMIEKAGSWAVGECVCKKEKRILGQGCDKPLEVCLAIAPIENVFDNHFWGTAITRDRALDILKSADDAGLVHLTSNTRDGNIFICNCCGCCCSILRGINDLGQMDCVARSHFIAAVDADRCTACGACRARCQVRAIDMEDRASVNDRCIGCGLCVLRCPEGALRLLRRDPGDREFIPRDERDWMRKRAASRKRDDYKSLLK